MRPIKIALAVLGGSLACSAVFAQTAPDAALVAQGQYLAEAGDCAACHTAPNGKAFAGGLSMASPIGTIYTSNITPDKSTGIGDWSYSDFARLMRKGVTKQGYVVYPAMPYPSYSRLTEPDLKAMYAYFMLGVQPVSQANRANGIPWPLSMRWPLRIWRWFYAPTAKPFVAAPGQGADIARGAYLVEGLGHCGACHTPRRITLQETALSDADGRSYLSGGAPVDGWPAPSLRNENGGGLAGWSEDDIVTFMKTGRNKHSASFGAMNDVVVDSLQYLSDSDLQSIAIYLKSLPPKNTAAQPYAYDDTATKALLSGDASARGAQAYVDRCAACHGSDGKGYAGVFPALAGNSILQTDDAVSAIHIILSGGRLPGTKTAPSYFVMGPYADVMTDENIADVVSYIETSWGNQGRPVTAGQVAAIRKTATPVSP